jgi:hypothetical protein
MLAARDHDMIGSSMSNRGARPSFSCSVHKTLSWLARRCPTALLGHPCRLSASYPSDSLPEVWAEQELRPAAIEQGQD